MDIHPTASPVRGKKSNTSDRLPTDGSAPLQSDRILLTDPSSTSLIPSGIAMEATAADNHHYQKLAPTDQHDCDETSVTDKDLSSRPSALVLPHLNWRWLALSLLLVLWIAGMQFVLSILWPRLLVREGHNLVYWTPHKTGSTSMRNWLANVAERLQIDISITHKYPNKPFEDYRQRYDHLKLKTCTFLAGHIRVRASHLRNNELRLGAVITTIRDPFALLMSKYFHRTRFILTNGALQHFADPGSRLSRLWFFYWNDLDPCEQLRYYDGEQGCELDQRDGVMTAIEKRARAIAERIDCVVDTDDPAHDLDSLCRQMSLGESECPQIPVLNVKKGNTLYDKMLTFPHIKAVMMRTANVTISLRSALMKRRCRFLDDGSLTTPGAEPPQWPFKGCNRIESTLEEDTGDDAPENDAHDDDSQSPDDKGDHGSVDGVDVGDHGKGKDAEADKKGTET